MNYYYYANFIYLFTDLDLCYMRVLFDRSVLSQVLKLAFRPASLKRIQLKTCLYIFFITFAFFKLFYGTGRKQKNGELVKAYIF